MSGREQIETPRENAPGKKGLARPIPNGGAYAGPVPPGLTWTLSDASTVGQTRTESRCMADTESRVAGTLGAGAGSRLRPVTKLRLLPFLVCCTSLGLRCKGRVFRPSHHQEIPSWAPVGG
jgi:hypothetical protein